MVEGWDLHFGFPLTPVSSSNRKPHRTKPPLPPTGRTIRQRKPRRRYKTFVAVMFVWPEWDGAAAAAAVHNKKVEYGGGSPDLVLQRFHLNANRAK